VSVRVLNYGQFVLWSVAVCFVCKFYWFL